MYKRGQWPTFDFYLSISNTISAEFSPRISDLKQHLKKQERYLFCMEFIQGVAKDFLGELPEHSHRLFQQIGRIAYCIDDHLDELSFDEKRRLQQGFSPFFDGLSRLSNAEEFQAYCIQFRRETLLLKEQHCSYHRLFQFYLRCKDLGLNQELKHFSLAIVESSLMKHQAQDSKAVLSAIQLEGRAAVNFLFKFLIKSEIVDLNRAASMHLLEYYYRLERLLNISDEIWDSRSDLKAGIIQLELGPAYYFKMLAAWTHAIFSAWRQKPILFIKHFLSFAQRAIQLEFKA